MNIAWRLFIREIPFSHELNNIRPLTREPFFAPLLRVCEGQLRSYKRAPLSKTGEKVKNVSTGPLVLF